MRATVGFAIGGGVWLFDSSDRRNRTEMPTEMPIRRTTIQIDVELLMTLKEQAHRQKCSLTRLVNQTSRAGLQAAKAPVANKPLFQQQPHSMAALKLCIDKALALAATLE